MTESNVLFIELESSTEGRAFDAFAPGNWIDMLGRPVEFKEGELKEYASNTQAAIESTRGESGEVAGLPIDAINHDKGNAAGWIVGIELVGNIIRVIPRWTDLGRDLITRGLQKFFSATVDIESRTIVGGSLTNWPAMKKNGRNQLRPIELSMNLCEIVESDDSHIGDENMSKQNDNTPEIVQPELIKTEPAVDQVAMREQIKAELLAEFQEKQTDDTAAKRIEDAVKLEAFADVADLSQARGQLVEQMQAALKAEFERVQADSGKMLNQMMAQMKRDQHIAEFSQRVVSGTDSRPYGLPVGQEEVETFLLSLTDQQREAAESILTRTHEQGLVQFSAIGHGKRLQGVATFPPEYSQTYASWLADGGSPREFFTINPELGEMAQYNLDEFEEK